MTPEQTLHAINSGLPSFECESGCVDCCSVAFWSPLEWSMLPEEVFERFGDISAARIQMRVFGGEKVRALLPIHRRRIMEISYRRAMAVTEMTSDQGLLLTSVGLNDVTCVFKEAGKGCAIYQYRPFICRVAGLCPSILRLACPKGIVPEEPLPDFSLIKRFQMWVSLFPQDTCKEVKH